MPANISVKTIGEIARQRLAPGRVFGQTSRGIFLRPDPGGILFISTETFRGPLTLNVDATCLPTLPAGVAYTFQQEHIQFFTGSLCLDVSEAVSWSARKPARDNSLEDRPDLSQCRGMLQQVISCLLQTDQERSLFLSTLSRLEELDNPDDEIVRSMRSIYEGIRCKQARLLIKGASGLLGWGTGLTPSGDDLITGLLLAASRWPELVPPGLDIQEVSSQVTLLARQKTTSLGASLIECAPRGQADERLVSALDGIILGKPGAPECARLLSAWGHSSGCDALAGMALWFL